MRKYGWQGSKREPKRVPKWSPKVRKIRAKNETKNSTRIREEKCGFEEVKTMKSVELSSNSWFFHFQKMLEKGFKMRAKMESKWVRNQVPKRVRK